MQLLCLAGRRLSVPRHGGDITGGRRGTWTHADPCGTRSIGRRDLAGTRTCVSTCCDGARCVRHYGTGHPDGQGNRECDGSACGLRRIDQPSAASSRHCPCSRLPYTDGCRLVSHQQGSASFGERSADRSCQLSDGLCLHGGRCAGGDAPSPQTWTSA